MKNHKLLMGFIATLVTALVLRLFVVDVISVSNDILQPEFYPGDFVLVSKLAKPTEGDWALLKDHPVSSAYSLRKLIKREGDQGWKVLEPAVIEQKASAPLNSAVLAAGGVADHSYVDGKNVLGQALLVLWSLPCKPSMLASGSCPDKTARFLKRVSAP